MGHIFKKISLKDLRLHELLLIKYIGVKKVKSMFARIFKPSKTAMQSGPAKTDLWVLEFDNDESKKIDPLMGWTSSSCTQSQVRLTFDNKEGAIAYAESNGLVYTITESELRKPVVRKNGYGENFATNRKISWTH